MAKLLVILFNRTKFSSFFLFILYLTAAFQLCLYSFFKVSGEYQNILLEAGHFTAIIGFFAGIGGVQFIITKSHAYDMGSLEMLGYSRAIYLTYYICVSFILVFFSTLAGLLAFRVFIHFYAASEMIQNQNLSYFSIIRNMIAIFLSSSSFFYIFHSRKDPMLLVKEKQWLELTTFIFHIKKKIIL